MGRPISMRAFRARIDVLYSTGRHARSTRGRMRQVLRELEQLGVKTTRGLTTAMMARYVAARGPAANPNTTNGLLGAIAAACSYAVEEGWLARLPNFRRVRPKPVPMTLNRPPSFPAVGALLRHLYRHRNDGWQAGRLCALVWTLALTGARLGEVLHLERADLRPPRAPTELRIDPGHHRLKTVASARMVPVPAALTALLEEWLPRTGCRWVFPGVRRRGPWTGGNAHDRPLGQVKRAAQQAGIGHATAHCLRHAFATAAFAEWSVPPWVTQQVMGHRDIRTTMRYAHLDGSRRIAEAMQGISYQPPAAHYEA